MDKNEEYWKFAESEKHFNEIQAGIRNLASGWMLAAFAAIALLLKTDKEATWVVPPAILVVVVSCMATLGLLVLWINDQLVYQRLLNSGFLVALKKEVDDPALPQVRCMMLYSTSGKGMSRWMTLFYSIPMVGFCAITAASTLLRKDIGDASSGVNSELTVTVLVALCAAQFLATCWVQFYRSEVPSSTRAAAFNEPKFTALFKGKPKERRDSLANLIARTNPSEQAKKAANA